MRARLRRIRDRLTGRSPLNSEAEAYARLARRGYSPGSIIDVGAYHGDWTKLARSIFPDPPILMVEAQTSKAEVLRTLCSEDSGISLDNNALAAESGQTMTFYEMETGSSLMPEQSDVPRKSLSVVTRTLDEIAGSLQGPIFLKLDVQGAELEVLKGGSETLSRCDLVQLELAFLQYNRGAPSLMEVLAFMDTKGFVPLDITNMTRPDHVNLVQADFLFCRADSPLRPTFFRFGEEAVPGTQTDVS